MALRTNASGVKTREIAEDRFDGGQLPLRGHRAAHSWAIHEPLEPTSTRRDPAWILLADAHAMFREAIRVALEPAEHLRVVGEARTVQETVAATAELTPEVVLYDLNLPNDFGSDPVRAITEAGRPSTRVLVLADLPRPDEIVALVEAGAAGYLTKDIPLAELVTAIRSVAKGEAVIPPAILGPLLATLVQRRRVDHDAVRRHASLTKREREVLSLIARGAGNDDIARKLVISPQTARTHVQNILSKLEVHSRLEAAALALRSGLAEIE